MKWVKLIGGRFLDFIIMGGIMRRLFLLTLAFTGEGVATFFLFWAGLMVLDEFYGDWPIRSVVGSIPLFLASFIGFSGFITLGVMLVKHVRDIFRK